MRLPHGGRLVAAVLLAPSVVIAVGSSSAVAAPSDGYADWTFGGTNRNFQGTVSLPDGFPDVSFTSDSRTPPSPPLPSGASSWLPAGSPFGAAFGSSEGKRYVSLRPNADGTPANPSTTTYDFASPTPTSGWGFALGDIDAETLTVSASDAAGDPVSAAGLGLQGAFNYCDASPRSSGCSGVTVFEVPVTSTTATAVSATNPDCPANPDECDTQGSAVWFSPTVPLSSLTVTSTWKAGLPVYQTWFAGASNAIRGAVSGECAAGTRGVDVSLLDGAGGDLLASTTTGGNGRYGFDRVLARDGYRVRIDPPPGIQVDGPSGRAADTSAGDATDIDFATAGSSRVRGSVVADTGPVEGARVSLTRGGAEVDQTTTDADGSYEFSGLVNGRYRVDVTAPGRYEPVGPTDRGVSVDCDAEAVAAFELQRVYVVEGDVVDEDGQPVPDAEVTVNDPDGTEVASTTTDDQGHYEIPGVPAGEYELEIDPPDPLATTTVDIEVPVGPDGVPPVTVLPEGEQLPDVGGAPLGLLVLGFGLLISGCGCVRRARRAS